MHYGMNVHMQILAHLLEMHIHVLLCGFMWLGALFLKHYVLNHDSKERVIHEVR